MTRGETPPPDLSGGIQWTTTPVERSGMQYGRQPAVKSRHGAYAPPVADPNRQRAVSEAPAASPERSAPAQESRSESSQPLRVDAEVREVKAPLPGVDESRYRAAEAPASSFSSDTPTAWDEEPKEYE